MVLTVISRCQDAIRAMSDDRKFSGRLIVKQSAELKIKSDIKYQSPLRRIPIVRFNFTTPPKVTDEVDGFALALDRILRSVGIVKESINLDESVESLTKSANNSHVDEDTASLTWKAALLGSKKPEVSSCEECKKRKQKTFVEVGSQCADNKETCSIGIQVNDEDLIPAKKKNESIALLTPAQLLGKIKEKESEKETIPEQGPEKKKVGTPFTSPEKRRPPPTRGRGGFRNSFPPRERVYYEQEEYLEEEEFFERPRSIYEHPNENFGRRFGGPPGRYPREYVEEEEMHFPEYSHPYPNRGGRFGPRF